MYGMEKTQGLARSEGGRLGEAWNTPQVTVPDTAKEAPRGCLELQRGEHQGMSQEGDTCSPKSSLDVCWQGMGVDGWGFSSTDKGPLHRGESKLSEFKDGAFKA